MSDTELAARVLADLGELAAIAARRYHDLDAAYRLEQARRWAAWAVEDMTK